MKKMLKTKMTFAIALFLTLTIVVTLVTLPLASAHTPVWQIPTFAYINVSPNPVGVGQTVSVVMWLDKVIIGASIPNDIRFHDYKLTITDPAGHTETKTWAIIWDTTSSAYTAYTPNQVGTYTFKFEYPGQTYTWTGDYRNDTYQSSSATTTLTVQDEQIAHIPDYPLPTEYWTRPIEGQNTGWYAVSSNYLDPFGAAYSFGSLRLQPYGTAPNSAHIMWTKPINFGGVVGGGNTGVNGSTFYSGLSYETRFNSPIIIYGRLYYGLPRGNNGGGGPYICVDLRTGEEIWRQTYAVNPSFGQLEWFDSPNQHGVIPNGYLWATQSSAGVTTWIAYDALDGNWLFNITNVPSGTRTYGPSGELLIYQVNIANKWMALWNITQVITNGNINALVAAGYRPVGSVLNSTLRDSYTWNVTLPTLPSDAVVRYAYNDDIMIGSAHTNAAFGQGNFGGIGTAPGNAYATFWAVSLKPNSRGNLVWLKDIPAPAGNITRQFGPADPVSRVFFFSDKETMQWLGYNLDTGEKLWGPIGDTRDFNYYPTVGSGGVSQIGFTAYGKLYTGGYGGEFFCYDSKTGNLLWKYNNTDSGFETPWGLYPIFPAAIADGKIYLYNNEHSPNSPPYKGSSVRCLDAITGEELWTLLGWAGVGGFADQGWPVADGYIAYLNTYDMQVYCIGKGPSATTVTAPNIGVTLGSSVIIGGTVTDLAAGTKQDEQAARFPNGVAAVSDESMKGWMEYVYMQKPMPTGTTGVEVIIDVLDANGNYRNIGTTTTDATGYYSYMWTPDIPGKYTVIATFMGSESYYGSYAEAAFGVDEAPEATPEPTQPPATLAEQYFLPMSIGMIAAIAIVGIAIIALLLRRK